MTTHSAEIERIVEVVMKRLQSAPAPVRAADSQRTGVRSASSKVLQVNSRVIALADLESKLEGLSVLQVQSSAVVTPAVIDELRERNIQLNRTLPADGQPTDCNLLILAPIQQLPHLRGTSKAEQEAVEENLKQIMQHQRAGGCVLWSATKPFEAAVATARLSELRVAHLSSPGKLLQAVAECKPNVLIVDASTWSYQATNALADQWRRKA